MNIKELKEMRLKEMWNYNLNPGQYPGGFRDPNPHPDDLTVGQLIVIIVGVLTLGGLTAFMVITGQQ